MYLQTFILRTLIYYVETSVLLENTPLKIHTKLHPRLKRRIFHVLTGEDIDNFTDTVRSVSDGITDTTKLKAMPSSASCITYKLLNSLVAHGDP